MKAAGGAATRQVPYRPGDRIHILHTCHGHDADVRPVLVRALTRLTGDGPAARWRVTATRCDGSDLEVVVDRDGRDEDGGITGASRVRQEVRP